MIFGTSRGGSKFRPVQGGSLKGIWERDSIVKKSLRIMILSLLNVNRKVSLVNEPIYNEKQMNAR